VVREKQIVIVDDHPLFREGLKVILGRSSRFEVVGEAGNGRDALELVTRFRPDVALLDISLPDQSGIELIGEIRRRSKKTHVLVVSVHSKIDYIAEAFKAGASGYVIKESTAERLLHALEYVMRGDYFLDSSVSQKVVKNLMEWPAREAKIHDDAYRSLTPREQEVMRLLAEGFDTKAVAEKLFISRKTVENHRTNIMNKLDLHGSHELVRYAAKLGLIDVDLWKT